MNELYQKLRDLDIAENEIETRIGEGWTLQQIWDQYVADNGEPEE